MKRFSDILKLCSGDNPAAVQAQARLRFPSEVSQSRFSLRRPMMPLSGTGTHVILGVATYSRQELNLLDEVNASLSGGNGQALEVDVFDVLECEQMSDFEKFIPGVGPVYQTPVLGVVANGMLVQSATGFRDVEGILRQHRILGSQSAPA